MVNLAKDTIQDGEVLQIEPANKMVSDTSDSLFSSDIRPTSAMPTRRSHADIMEEEGVDELTAYDILADEEQSFNDVLNRLHEKSVQEKEARAKVAQDALDAVTALIAKRASHRVIWIRVSITSFTLFLASIIAYVVVGLV